MRWRVRIFPGLTQVTCFPPLDTRFPKLSNYFAPSTHHITDIDTLIKLKEILAIQYSKDKIRGVDYRKTLIFVTIALYPIASRDVRLLLVTLCEMIEIYYAQDEARGMEFYVKGCRLHHRASHTGNCLASTSIVAWPTQPNCFE